LADVHGFELVVFGLNPNSEVGKRKAAKCPDQQRVENTPAG
jgi:hypothetical protein